MSKTKSTRVPHPHIYTVEKVMTKKELEEEVKRLRSRNLDMLVESDRATSEIRELRNDCRGLMVFNIFTLSAITVAIIVKVWVLS